MVLVIGVLGAWGKGKTMTLNMLADLIKQDPQSLGLPSVPLNYMNFQSVYMDGYLAIDPPDDLRYVTFDPNHIKGQPPNQYPDLKPRTAPVIDFLSFLRQPRSEVPIMMFLDDVYGWLASYFFGSKFNQIAFRLLAAGRKKNLNIAESSVRFKDVDPRLRALHSHLFLPRFSEAFETVAVERYVVDVFEDKKLNPDIYFSAKAYYGTYDTNEVIESVYESGRGATAVNNLGAIPISTGGQVMALAGNNGHNGHADLGKVGAGLGNDSALRLNQASESGPLGSPAPRPETATPPMSPVDTTPLRPRTMPTAPATTLGDKRIPDGYESYAIGFQWQGQIAAELIAEGYFVRQMFGKNEPDIICYADQELTRPVKVVAVKAYNLVPYSDRYEDPLGMNVTRVTSLSREADRAGAGSGGSWSGKRRHSGASGRTITRADIEPEIRSSKLLGIPCELVIVNTRNGARARFSITDQFDRLPTPSSLNDD